jgi:hypothetical protein
LEKSYQMRDTLLMADNSIVIKCSGFLRDYVLLVKLFLLGNSG